MSIGNKEIEKHKDIELKVASFPKKLYELISSEEHKNLINWNEEGDKFIVFDNIAFTKELLGGENKFSNAENYSSFIRQLNMYDFHKLKSKNHVNVFYNNNFRKNKPELLIHIKRKQSNPRKYGRLGNDNTLSASFYTNRIKSHIKPIFKVIRQNDDSNCQLFNDFSYMSRTHHTHPSKLNYYSINKAKETNLKLKEEEEEDLKAHENRIMKNYYAGSGSLYDCMKKLFDNHKKLNDSCTKKYDSYKNFIGIENDDAHFFDYFNKKKDEKENFISKQQEEKENELFDNLNNHPSFTLNDDLSSLDFENDVNSSKDKTVKKKTILRALNKMNNKLEKSIEKSRLLNNIHIREKERKKEIKKRLKSEKGGFENNEKENDYLNKKRNNPNTTTNSSVSTSKSKEKQIINNFNNIYYLAQAHGHGNDHGLRLNLPQNNLNNFKEQAGNVNLIMSNNNNNMKSTKQSKLNFYYDDFKEEKNIEETLQKMKKEKEKLGDYTGQSQNKELKNSKMLHVVEGDNEYIDEEKLENDILERILKIVSKISILI